MSSLYPTREDKEETLKKTYGDDFNAFFYSSQISDILQSDAVGPVSYREHPWAEKHPFNIPGPFFTADTTNCGTGRPEAADNVMYDADGYEYIYRQPSNYHELIQVLNASAVEICGGYSCYGNQRWTYDSCKEWWANRADMIIQLNDPKVDKTNEGNIHLYIDYLSTSAELDLRRYCFFLLNKYYPAEDNLDLPALS